MIYKIQILEKIEKKFVRLPKKDKERIIEKINLLATNPKPADCKKLQGHKKPPLYRVRVGDWRIIYTVEDSILLVLVIEVGHRKEVYK